MSTFIVTSHGADFFGQDHYTVKAFMDVADSMAAVSRFTIRWPVERLLREPGDGQTIPPEEAGTFAEILLHTARHRLTKPKTARHARALADAAARAAAAGEPWTWTTHA